MIAGAFPPPCAHASKRLRQPLVRQNVAREPVLTGSIRNVPPASYVRVMAGADPERLRQAQYMGTAAGVRDALVLADRDAVERSRAEMPQL